MPRRALELLACSFALAFGVAAAASPSPRQDTDLAAYLDRLGLEDLLALELERIAFGRGPLPEARQRAVERLAELYPALLERAPDADARTDLEGRIDRLLAKQPPREAEELRLALLRARYRAAARIAEEERVALATPEAVAEAKALFDELVRELPSLRSRLESRARSIDRRSDNLPVVRAERILDLADRLRVRVAQSVLLEGWARLYRVLLGGLPETEAARELEAAATAFARIVDTGEAYPQPKDVSLDLRGDETFGEAILGLALCRSRGGSPSVAREWLELLDVPQAAAPLRDAVPAWRMVLALEEGNVTAARTLLEDMVARPETPAAWLRLAAVGGLRRRERDATATLLAREAIAALAAKRELGQVLDLARRFGRDLAGDAGFPARYVAGVLAHEEGRAARDAGDEGAARARFAEAAAALERALGEPDAPAYAASLAACRTLAAWCRFECGEFATALAGFDAAAGDEAADWMGIVCLDRLVAAAPDDAATPGRRADLARRVDAFLDRHPSSPNVPALLRMRLAAQGIPERADIDRMLGAVGDGAEAVAARRQAALALYRLYRATPAAPADAKAEVGRAFLAALATLPTERGLPAGDPGLARQAAEVALGEEVAADAAAEIAIAALERHAARLSPEIAAPLEAELAVRRLQLDLRRARFAEALVRLGGIEALPEARDDLREFARRAVFRAAAGRYRDGAADAPDRAEVRDATLEAGWLVVLAAQRGVGSLADALALPGIESTAALVVAAARERLAVAPDPVLVARVLPLAEALRTRRPRDAGTLEALADLAGLGGDRARAAELLRELVAGSPVGSERWFRAKAILVETLAEIDPERARAVLRQHVALQPSYGPSPWGERLRAVEAKLGGGGT